MNQAIALDQQKKPLSTIISELLGIAPKSKRPVVNNKEFRSIYGMPESFAQFLRVRDQDEKTRVFIFDDERSCGVALRVGHVSAQDRAIKDVMERHESLLAAFDTVPERDENPYIIEMFTHNVPLVDLLYEAIDYADQTSGQMRDKLQDDYTTMLHDHFDDLTSEQGIFREGKYPWRGTRRVTYVLLYRTFSSHDGTLQQNIDEINETAERIEYGLNAAGLSNYRIDENDYYQWLYPWFNKGFEGKSAHDFCHNNPYVEGESINGVPDYDVDLIDWVMGSDQPDSNEPTPDDGTWVWGEHHVRFVPVVGYKARPEVGAVTIAHTKANAENADETTKPLFNRLPDHTIYTLKIICIPQDTQQLDLEQIESASRANVNSAKAAMQVIKPALQGISLGYKQYPVFMGFFIRGESKEETLKSARQAISHISSQRLRCIDLSNDLFALDEAAKSLPFAYQPEYDKFLMRQHPQWLHDIVSLMPFWGQSEITGHPCFLLFDRVGNPIYFDPLSEDRMRVAHMFLAGPTGSGKSSLLNALLLSLIVVHRPQLHLIDYGGSYTYLAEYAKEMGLTVRHTKCDPSNPIALPLFGNAQDIIDEAEGNVRQIDYDNADNEDYEEYDLLSKNTFISKVMIAGGIKRLFEQINNADNAIIKEAIIMASYERINSDEHHQVITSDIVAALQSIARGNRLGGKSDTITEKRSEKIFEMADAMNYYTMGFYGKMFDRPSEPFSPDVDINITDIGILGSSSDYNDAFTLVWIGLLNHLQALSEFNKQRGHERDIILGNDEAHITMEAEMLPPHLARGSKTFRKQRIWLILATQNLEDVPPEAKKIVSMTEFQFYLSMKKSELEDLEKFVDLTDEHRKMILSCKKEPGKFVEGVLLSDRYPPQIFRNVPLPLAMALGQTESKEREKRNQVKAEFGYTTETDITRHIAKMIRDDRRVA